MVGRHLLPNYFMEIGFFFLPILFSQLTSCTEQIVQLMQERDILQDANNQMNEVNARKLQVSNNTMYVPTQSSSKLRYTFCTYQCQARGGNTDRCVYLFVLSSPPLSI